MVGLFQGRSVAVYCLLIILISTQTSLLKLCSAQLAGFLSIDCGSGSSQTYKDSLGIEWTPDASLMQEGSTAIVQAPPGNKDTRYGSIRYFEGNQTKYCFVLSGSGLVVEGKSYLVRAAFWLGPNLEAYATQGNDSTLLEFKLIVDAYEAAKISIPLPQSAPVVKEIYLQAQSNSIAVCLSGSVTGSDAPFISSLELRPLNDIMNPVVTLKTSQRALLLAYTRVNYGTPDNYPDVRYPEDAIDRIWYSNWAQPSNSTNHSINYEISDIPPISVLQTAYISNWTGFVQWNYSTGIIANQQYFYAIYFSEIDPRVNASGLRVFSIFIDDTEQYTALDVYKNSNNYGCVEIYGNFTTTSDYTVFKYVPTSTSKYLPLVSAIEILEILQSPMSSGTFNGDIFALDGIKASLANLSSYTGDPCLPQSYGYSWLNCASVIPPRVIGISLSNYGLTGEIPTSINDLTHLTEIKLNDNHLNGPIPDLSALTSLEVLDLSNNKLSGPIPNSLATLRSLKYLYLKNNNLSGTIPPSLLTLQIDYSGNPFLCVKANATCVSTTSIGKGNANVGVIVGLIVGGLIISILVVFGIVYIRRRKQTAQVEQPPPTTTVVGRTQVLEVSNVAQAFIYRDIEVATNNFNLKLGGGGFGPVYQGKLMNGRKVAIKVLSQVSQQGAKEFLNELGLLSRVHHKNLVGLLGYCIEQNLVLVYEYLSKGSLFDCLHGPHAHNAPLSWRSRLQIMVDAASGLEYLHHGCNPQIIHRDVKSSNILLSEDMEAKIGDFGISRFRRADFDEAITTLMGSWGYLDPEYTSTLNLTEKVDVYSFGVLLFEILCGRRPIKEAHIVEWVRPHIERGAIDEIVDRSMGGYNVSAVWKVVEVAVRCVEARGMDRPNMGEICSELKDAMHFEMMGDHVSGSAEPSLEYFPSNTSYVQLR